jgi:hypothetical protein
MLKKYLKWLSEDNETESVGGFAIDSFPNKANKKPLPVVYPENIVGENYNPDVERIMIDFDRTIHKYSEGWKDGSIYDEPFDGVKEVIKILRENGYEIVIFTCRLSETANGKENVEKQKILIKDWLKKYEIEVDGMTAEKLPALAYIDDSALYFDGQWNKEFVNQIKNRIT